MKTNPPNGGAHRVRLTTGNWLTLVGLTAGGAVFSITLLFTVFQTKADAKLAEAVAAKDAEIASLELKAHTASDDKRDSEQKATTDKVVVQQQAIGIVLLNVKSNVDSLVRDEGRRPARLPKGFDTSGIVGDP